MTIYKIIFNNKPIEIEFFEANIIWDNKENKRVYFIRGFELYNESFLTIFSTYNKQIADKFLNKLHEFFNKQSKKYLNIDKLIMEVK
jgi:hypothetical protein